MNTAVKLAAPKFFQGFILWIVLTFIWGVELATIITFVGLLVWSGVEYTKWEKPVI